MWRHPLWWETCCVSVALSVVLQCDLYVCAAIPDEQPIEFATMLGIHDKSHWLEDEPSKEYQHFFNSWYDVTANIGVF